jgi:hypothetical protein
MLWLAALAVGAASCASVDLEPDYSRERGTQLVEEAYAGITSAFQPKPVAPSLAPKGAPNFCGGLTSDGSREPIQRRYVLGSETPSVRDAWFSQIYAYLAMQGYKVGSLKAAPVSPKIGRTFSATHPDNHVRIYMGYSLDEVVHLSIQSGCVPIDG